MNKQEAIEKIKNIETLNINDIIAGQSSDMVIKNQVLDIISQIDEPQKVIIPKFVAEWYEKNNDDLNTAICGAIIGAYRKVNGENDDFLDTFEELVVYEDNSILILVQMKLFGYEIEQEKLYTVEIPNNGGTLVLASIRYAIQLVDSNKHFPGKFTKESIEEAGFGWVFDCDGVKVVEME